jgi:uncharacterized protein (TIGR02996 family)
VAEREAFLAALKANEDDVTTRLVYADWLDENGEHEEADRQRKWPAAKQWLLQFLKWINYEDEEFDEQTQEFKGKGTFSGPHTYKDAIQAGYDAVAGRGYTFGSDAGAEFFWEGESNSEEFFRNWSIVTGVPVPQSVIDNPPFRCAC